MSESRFYFCRDVMQMMECKENKAYKIIRQLNGELKAKGILTYDGRVPKNYFDQRYGLKKGA